MVSMVKGSNGVVYRVDGDAGTCTCRDYQFRGWERPCKHLLVVQRAGRYKALLWKRIRERIDWEGFTRDYLDPEKHRPLQPYDPNEMFARWGKTHD